MARPESEPKTPLAARLRGLRRQLGDLDREVFAKKIGISKNSLASYERGENEPSATVLFAYIDSFEIDANWLLTGEGEIFSDPTLTAKAAPPVDPALMERLYKLVEETAKEHNYRLSASQMSHEAAQLYNELINRITDITDTEEIAVIIPQIKYLYSKRLAKSKPENAASNVA